MVTQRKYTQDILNEMVIIGSRPCNTPMKQTMKFKIETVSVPTNKGRY